ncbi:MAG: recombinase family protein [Bdellovibrionaceae bacterium]|nr:recombinase family protein [Pseudobdellovibrionaceae bacterium]
MMQWWTEPTNKQRPQPHVIIELPFLAKVHSRDRIAELYRAGNSLREIERQLNIPKSTTLSVLKNDGIEIRSHRDRQSFLKASPIGMRAGTIPYGYCYLDGKLVVDPHEYKNVLKILQQFKKGMSYRSIARGFNCTKIRTRMGKIWTHEIIKRICDRELNKKRRK